MTSPLPESADIPALCMKCIADDRLQPDQHRDSRRWWRIGRYLPSWRLLLTSAKPRVTAAGQTLSG